MSGCGVEEEDLDEVPSGGAEAGCGGGGGCGSGVCAGAVSESASVSCSCVAATSTSSPSATTASSSPSPTTCVKCGTEAAAVVARQREALCASCLEATLFNMFKTVVRTKGLIHPNDRVLLAFSGGFASRAALHLLTLIMSDSRNAKDRGRIHFNLGVVFVDERIALGQSDKEADDVLREVISIVRVASGGRAALHIAKTEDLYIGEEDDSEGAERRAAELVRQTLNVSDVTGREDLLEHLRMRVLMKVASADGYNKLVRGDCASRLAVRTISATSKGRGFSLAADIQYVDTRYRVLSPVPHSQEESQHQHHPSPMPVIVTPLRDIMIKELAMLCHLQKLRTVFVPKSKKLAAAMRKGSINMLADYFVATLQANLNSSVHTILATASKLKPFSFNEPLMTARDASRLLAGKQASSTHCQDNNHPSSLPLCSLCYAPMATTARPEVEESTGLELGDAQSKTQFCHSCQSQILDCMKENWLSLTDSILKTRAAHSVDARRELNRRLVQDCLLE
eukprot:jgi/Chlat1/888/Chrsp107S01331